MTNKSLFIIRPQSIVDVITNSSTELFIFPGQSKEIVENLIEELYPNYLDEYYPVIAIEELNAGEMYYFLAWVYVHYENSYYECTAPQGISLEDITEVEPGRSYGCYKDNREFSLEKIAENLELLKKALAGTFLLYSIHDNPNWEMQQKLELIGTRKHLG